MLRLERKIESLLVGSELIYNRVFFFPLAIRFRIFPLLLLTAFVLQLMLAIIR